MNRISLVRSLAFYLSQWKDSSQQPREAFTSSCPSLCPHIRLSTSRTIKLAYYCFWATQSILPFITSSKYWVRLSIYLSINLSIYVFSNCGDTLKDTISIIFLYRDHVKVFFSILSIRKHSFLKILALFLSLYSFLLLHFMNVWSQFLHRSEVCFGFGCCKQTWGTCWAVEIT